MIIMKVKVAQSCPTLCYPMVYTVQGILQARILEWVAIPLSRGSSQPRDQTTRETYFGVIGSAKIINKEKNLSNTSVK